ncbi:MAG: putative zinc-binding protein [candidate division KSB1 bacterium]|nr:putative zinc-binding protein [candidate division KSB1 bacterium]MDZ7402297.1 putative zinc-binding protein [candidate division KSB1 bacterium]
MEQTLPKIGLLVCNSGSSNSGTLTGIVAYGMIKEFDGIGIFSLPALANRIPKQIALIKQVPRLIVLDGCKNECARKIAEQLEIPYAVYLNLEADVGIEKMGPFTTMDYSVEELRKAREAVQKFIVDAV